MTLRHKLHELVSETNTTPWPAEAGWVIGAAFVLGILVCLAVLNYTN